jgi:hypothetical protein
MLVQLIAISTRCLGQKLKRTIVKHYVDPHVILIPVIIFAHNLKAVHVKPIIY